MTWKIIIITPLSRKEEIYTSEKEYLLRIAKLREFKRVKFLTEILTEKNWKYRIEA